MSEAIGNEDLVSILGQVIVPASADGREDLVGPRHPRVCEGAHLAVVGDARQERSELLCHVPVLCRWAGADVGGPWRSEEDALEDEAALLG